MKTQSFKLFIATLVIGIATVTSAFAQTNVNFEIPFDFQIGKKQMDAGKYQIRQMDAKKYILKNVETNKSMFLIADAQVGDERTVKTESLAFNRYGNTYFLREIYARSATVGSELGESKSERKIRKNNKNNPKLAQNKSKPERVLISSAQ